ncbi:MAG: Flp pilus assembly complex ATPase component TadA, partial [Candidatus Omnitrophica bacterium]|nr:Flp pilus assembly complex ATPase component TadA [Candidatus Omnitrophota bacterium]
MTAVSLRQRFVDLLVSKHGISRAKLDEILAAPHASDKGVGALLVERGLITQQALVAALAEGLAIPPINLAKYTIDPSLAQLVPERIVRQYHIVPVSKIGRHLTVAMADPLNVLALDDVATLTSLETIPVIASGQAIEQAIRQLYQNPTDQLETFMAHASEETAKASASGEEVMDLTAFGMAGMKAPIVKVVDLMIAEALKARASDIHVEPYEQEVRVRYRVDGALQEAFRVPKRYQSAFVTRLKIMAQVDITENRLPQDGRFKVRMDNREVDFRVSVLPISFGNKLVLRALDKSNLSLSLDALGLLPDSLEAFRQAVARPYGMILVTGPTGSGKSTTLYSVLGQMNEPGRNILTVEDPVEYQVDGITQVQVNPE